jgi:hypothetical protein
MHFSVERFKMLIGIVCFLAGGMLGFLIAGLLAASQRLSEMEDGCEPRPL